MNRLDLPVTRRQFAFLVAGAVLATIVGAVIAAVQGVSVVEIAALVFLIGVATVLFVIPVHWLPAFAVLFLAFFPSRFVPSDGPFRALPPITLLLVIWAFRRLVLRQGDSPEAAGLPPFQPRGLRLWIYVPAAFMVLWLAYSTLTSSSTSTSISWSVSFIAAVITPMLVPDSRREGILLRQALMWSGAIMGAYAFVELGLQQSPIYGTIYELLGRGIDRDWSVYRSFASFAHPLVAAAFFTIPSMISLGEWARTGKFRYLVMSGFAMLGVFATVSRGSILALAVASGFLFVTCLFDREIRMRGRIIGFVLLGVVGILFASTFAPLQERQDSMEAALSNGARELGLTVALKAAAVGEWLGTGPGTSGRTGRIFDDVVIENSALQLLISIGVLGLLTVIALLAGLMINALGNRDVGTPAAVVALAVSFAGFNAIDAVLYLHFLIGLLVLLSLSSFSPSSPSTDAAIRAPRRTDFPVPVSNNATSGG